MKLAFGADHAGFALKQALTDHARKAGHEARDFGAHSTDSVDYPDIAALVAQAVACGDVDRGILVCGTGIGMAMVANKVAGIRAANCEDPYSAAMARAHNDANVLTVGSRVVGPGVAELVLEHFLETPFEAGRHRKRLDKFPH